MFSYSVEIHDEDDKNNVIAYIKLNTTPNNKLFFIEIDDGGTLSIGMDINELTDLIDALNKAKKIMENK